MKRGVLVSAAAISSDVRANVNGTPASRAVSRIRATKNRSVTTATTGEPPDVMDLIGLLGHAEGVALPLGEERERGEVAHAVDVDDPVQVIGLVLDDPREEVLGHEVHAPALAVVTFQAHGGVTRNAPAHVGHRE